MAAYQVRRLCHDAYQVWLYNSGPTIFLYDDAYGEAIKEANPSLLMGYHGIPAQDVDAALLALGARGLLIVFALYQDDELQAAVSLGPPLSEAEAEGIPWSAPAQALLSLPSGTFCIESLDSLRLGPEEPTDTGTHLTLPPGDYVVALQCLSCDYAQTPGALVPEYYLGPGAARGSPRTGRYGRADTP